MCIGGRKRHCVDIITIIIWPNQLNALAFGGGVIPVCVLWLLEGRPNRHRFSRCYGAFPFENDQTLDAFYFDYTRKRKIHIEARTVISLVGVSFSSKVPPTRKKKNNIWERWWWNRPITASTKNKYSDCSLLCVPECCLFVVWPKKKGPSQNIIYTGHMYSTPSPPKKERVLHLWNKSL